MKDLDDFDAGRPNAVHDPIWSLDQFADVGPVVVCDLAARGGERLELVSTPEDAVDDLVRLIIGCLRRDPRVDVGQRLERTVRPNDPHFGMLSFSRIWSLVHDRPASRSAIPSSTLCCS